MRKIKRPVELDSDAHGRLMALSRHTRVPAAEYVREGLDAVLGLAEKQQTTAESSVAAWAADRKLD